MPRELRLALNGPQRAAFEVFRPRNTVFLGWGRGVGKTWFKRHLWWLLIAQWEHRLRESALEPFRGVRITSLAPTLKQWKDINWGGIVEEVGPRGKWAFLGAKLDHQTGQIRFPGGSIIRPFPATEYNARTARGMRTDVLDADEVDDIDAEVYDAVAVPWLSEPWSLAIELLAGTPTRGRHGLWWRTLRAGRLGERLRGGESAEDVLTEEEIDRYSSLAGGESAGLEDVVSALRRIHAFHATYKEAPETVSKRAVARAIATTPEATFRREWLADPDAGEGLVYPFAESIHVRQPPPLDAFNEFHVGVDWGWADPGVMVLAGIQGHGNDATVWLLDEWYETECPLHTWVERAKNWSFATFWCDRSRPSDIHELRTAGGCDARKADNEILGGVARVASLIHPRRRETDEVYARMYFSPKVPNTIREFGTYRHKKRPDGSFEDKPADKDNHAPDAVRYLCVGRFGRGTGHRHVVSGR